MASLSPSPVLINPLEKKKEVTMSQMTSLVKAEKAAEKVRVLVRTARVRQVKAQPPTGSGLRMRPEMVVRKSARSCHPLVGTL